MPKDPHRHARNVFALAPAKEPSSPAPGTTRAISPSSRSGRRSGRRKECARSLSVRGLADCAAGNEPHAARASRLASLMRELAARGVNLADILRSDHGVERGGGDSQKRFGSRLGVLLQMPIIGPTASPPALPTTLPFDVGDRRRHRDALGRLDRSPANMKGGARYTRLIAPALRIRASWLQCRCLWRSPR